jgi:hypothetical protein
MGNYTLILYTPGVSESDKFYGLIHNAFIPLQRKLQNAKEYELRYQEAAKVA